MTSTGGIDLPPSWTRSISVLHRPGKQLVPFSLSSALRSAITFCVQLRSLRVFNLEETMTTTLRLGWPLLLLIFASPLRAQLPLDLADKKDFRALRLASTDPKFKNDDYRRIEPGETLELGR